MAQRPNILSPTLREKKRYLAYQLIAQQPVAISDLYNAIWFSLLNFLGEIGVAQAEIWLVRDAWSEKKQIGIIKCSHTAVEQVRTALALINRIGDTPVIVRVLGISGTLKGARRKFLGEITLAQYG